MGAEMRYAFQKETPEGWKTVSDNFSGDRNYQLFGWLGLRCRNVHKVTPISELRDLPDDLIDEDEEHIELRFGQHSYSWLSAKEILEAPTPAEPSEVMLTFIAETARLQQHYGKVRVVFGFED